MESVIELAEAKRNLFCRKTVFLCCAESIRKMKPDTLRITTHTSLREIGSIFLLVLLMRQIINPDFLNVENMAVELHMGMPFTNRSVERFQPKQGSSYLSTRA